MNNHESHEPSRQLISYPRPNKPLVLSTPQGGATGEEGLADYWRVLVKRRWTILGVAIALTALVVGASYMMTPEYRATARIEIEPETPPLQSETDIYQRVDADDPFMQTQIQVLTGQTVAWQTIEKLNLVPHLGVIPHEQLTRERIEDSKVPLIDAFERNLKVELLPKTRILTVGYDSPDRQLSAQVVSTLTDTYLNYNYQQKYDAIRRSGWMEQQLAEFKDKVEKSQQALVEYEREHQIAANGDKQDVQAIMLTDLSRDLTLSQSDRILKESLYNQVIANRQHLASLVHDELLQTLEQRAADLKGLFSEAVTQYGPNFPKAKRIQLQIAEEQSQIEHEQNRIIDRIRNDYDAARERERLASAAVGTQRAQVGNLNELLVQDNLLRHEFESNQQLYQSLLQRLKDATVSAGLRSTNIHMVDAALVPTAPVKPKKLLYGAIAFLAGLILGVMLAFAQDGMDTSVRSAEEAESLTATAALGVIPFERGSGRRAGRLVGGDDGNSLVFALTKHPHSSLSEAFRALGTAISVPTNLPRTLLVTSAENGEGKTVTALNLGQALSQRNGRVLVMDCDLRRSGIAEALGIANDKGVSTLLSGEHELAAVLRPYDSQPNLWILPSGPVPVNPAELLASPRMAALLNQLTGQFSCVIIDSPPVLAVTDATILANMADGVLLVAASGSTPRSGLIRTRKILARAGANILGVAVNKVDPRFQSYRNYGYTSASKPRWKRTSLIAS
jgi:succinoglycan biosynthesis transport protein ExoP